MQNNGNLKLMVMNNRLPWNHLLLQGLYGGRRRRQGRYRYVTTGAKSGGQIVRHRGLVLLRTPSSRIDLRACEEQLVCQDQYGPNAYRTPCKKHGLTLRQKLQRLQSTRGTIVGAAELVYCTGELGQVEYGLRNLREFPNPVPLSVTGAVRWFTTEVTSELEAQLRKVGMWQRAVQTARCQRATS